MIKNDRIQDNNGTDRINRENGSLDPEHLIELFTKFEKKQAATRRLVIGVNTVLFILYTAIAASQNGAAATGYRLCGLGFVLGAAYLYFRYRPLPASAYALSILDYLRKAEKQLRYLTASDFLVILPLLIIIGIGGGLIFTDRLSNYTDRIDLLTGIWAVFFTGLCIFGFWAGRRNWIRDNMNIHRAFTETIRSIEDGDSF